jgi:hypothetical protein
MFTGIFNKPAPRAHGGFATAGGAYMVGERGPELFVPRQSGSIVPNHQVNNNNQQATIQIYAPELTSLDDDFILETRIMPKIEASLRERGIG